MKNIGKQIGIYKIIDVYNNKDKDGHTLYKCQCSVCGEVFIKRLSLIFAPVENCKHKDFKWQIPEIGKKYRKFMRSCYESTASDYKFYGSAGIDVCEQWREDKGEFEKWAIQNGYQPGYYLQRIDKTKGFYPENCMFASKCEVKHREDISNNLTAGGKTRSGKQWSKAFDLGVNTINNLVRKNGKEMTIKLIEAMLISPPQLKTKRRNQSWFEVYNIS